MSNKTIDARGLSCPQPVLLANEEMKNSTADSFEICVDCGVSPENVARAAEYAGWVAKTTQDNGQDVRMTITKDS